MRYHGQSSIIDLHKDSFQSAQYVLRRRFKFESERMILKVSMTQ